MRLEVSQTKVLARVLDGMGIDYTIISDLEADVFGQWNITELTLAMAKSGCDIISMTPRNESLESYYLNMMGGGSHA